MSIKQEEENLIYERERNNKKMDLIDWVSDNPAYPNKEEFVRYCYEHLDDIDFDEMLESFGIIEQDETFCPVCKADLK